MRQAPLDFGQAWRLTLLAAAAAALLCLQYPLMALYRRACQSHYPDQFHAWKNDGSFAVIGMWGLETSDEANYAARVQEAARHWIPGDPYVREATDARLVSMDFITYASMGLVQRVIGDINLTWILLRWACAFAWFLLLYAMALKATEHRSLSLILAGFITFFSYTLTLLFLTQLDWSALSPKGLGRMLWVMGAYGRTEGVLRLPRPGITYAALFGASLLMAKTAEPCGRRWAAWGGLAVGLLAYIRLDVWSAAMVASGILPIVEGMRRRAVPWPLMLAFSVGLLSSVPWMLTQLPFDPALLASSGTIWGRRPDVTSLIYLAAFAGAWRWGRRPMLLWFGAVCFGVFVALNLQVITGYTHATMFHWKYFGNIFVFLTATCLLLPRFLSGAASFKPGLIACAMMGGLCLLQGVIFAGLRYPFQALPRDTEDALLWLKTHTEPDSVIASLGVEANTLIPVYAHNKTLMSYPNPIASGVGVEENMRRLAYMLSLLGTGPERYIRECVAGWKPAEERGLDRAAAERSRWRILYAFYTPLERIPAMLRRPPSEATGKQFDADYIWFGHLEKDFAAPSFPEAAPVALEPVYENPSVTIYRIRKKG